MAQYEVMILADAQGEQDPGKMMEEWEKLVKKLGGKISAKDDWGERSLAYTLKGQDRGHYTVLKVELEPKMVKKLATQLKLTKGIIRSLVTKIN